MFKRLASKQGAALESAIMFMMIVFMFCTMITTVAVTGRYRAISERRDNEFRLQKDLIAEKFLAYVKTYGTGSFTNFTEYAADEFEGYAFEDTQSGNEFALTVKNSSGSAVLHITAVRETGGSVTMTECTTSAAQGDGQG